MGGFPILPNLFKSESIKVRLDLARACDLHLYHNWFASLQQFKDFPPASQRV